MSCGQSREWYCVLKVTPPFRRRLNQKLVVTVQGKTIRSAEDELWEISLRRVASRRRDIPQNLIVFITDRLPDIHAEKADRQTKRSSYHLLLLVIPPPWSYSQGHRYLPVMMSVMSLLWGRVVHGRWMKLSHRLRRFIAAPPFMDRLITSPGRCSTAISWLSRCTPYLLS